MKKLIIVITAVLLAACYGEDNLNYVELNDVTVENIEVHDWYEKFAYVDTLNIRPQITLALGGSEDHLSYEWKLIPVSDTYNPDSLAIDVQDASYIIGTEKNLSYPLNNAPGEYAGYFLAKDNNTGVTYKTDFFVRLRTTVSDGWMVLCEQEGKTRMDMVSHPTAEETIVARDIWRDLDIELGRPYNLLYVYSMHKSDRLLYCDAGTFALSNLELIPKEENNLIWSFGEAPARIEAAALGVTLARASGSQYEMLITVDGDLYMRDYMSIATGGVFDYRKNKFKGTDTYFRLAPFLGYTSYKWQGTQVIVVYDRDNRRFLKIDNLQEFPQEMVFSNSLPGGLYAYPAETGRDMVYMESAGDGHVLALMKTPGKEEYYVYGMMLQQNNIVDRTFYVQVPITNAQDITCYAFHNLYRLLYYGTKNGEVYVFNVERPELGVQKVEGICADMKGEHITSMRFHRFRTYSSATDWEKRYHNCIVLGSYNPNLPEAESGFLRVYNTGNNVPLEKRLEIDKLGKVVSVEYRDRKDQNTSIYPD